MYLLLHLKFIKLPGFSWQAFDSLQGVNVIESDIDVDVHVFLLVENICIRVRLS